MMRMTRRKALFSFVTSLMLGHAWPVGAAGQADADGVSVTQALAELQAKRVLLIDIREPDEQATGVAPGAKVLPMSQLGQRLAEIPNDPKQPVLLVCNTQNRSRATLQQLRERGGYTNVRYVQGGMSEWRRQGLPLVLQAR